MNMKLRNLHEAEEALRPYASAMTRSLRKEASLGPMRQAMAEFDDVQMKLPMVHVAGTSGKTSTTHYIASLLMAAGYTVGHTESPHVSGLNERLQINLEPLDEVRFASMLGDFLERVEKAKLPISYFELLIAFVYDSLYKLGVDWAVIETGLGGTHDATNVADHPGKICVITDIGLDHTAILGNTLTEIAGWKAGIIHAGNTAFMLSQAPEVIAVVQARADKVGATLHVVDEAEQAGLRMEIGEGINELPLFQQRNAVLAYAAVKDKLSGVSLAEILNALRINIPGRMEIHELPDGHTVVLDGAHNPQKMAALAAAFKTRFPGEKAGLLIGMKQSKDFESTLDEIMPFTSSAIVTTFEMQQDMPIHAIPPEKLEAYLTDAGISTRVVSDYRQAFDALLTQSENVLLVTGSIYLIGQVKAQLEQL
jgi:dihydrofolate synthase/folylpolyglutamate synthase